MVINSATFVRDTLFYLKNSISSNVTDPISSTRPANSRWVMTSYPQRETVYPLITIKVVNYTAARAGMQTTNMDVDMDIEVRIWGRNTKERDELFTKVLTHLQSIQFTATTGSTNNYLHDFNMPSATEINEDGTGIKSKVCSFTYKFFDL